jgi:hypothetical protein
VYSGASEYLTTLVILYPDEDCGTNDCIRNYKYPHYHRAQQHEIRKISNGFLHKPDSDPQRIGYFFCSGENPISSDDLPPYANPAPHRGRMAHCDAPVLPEGKFFHDSVQVIRHNRNRGLPGQRMSLKERHNYYQIISPEQFFFRDDTIYANNCPCFTRCIDPDLKQNRSPESFLVSLRQ